MNTLTNRMLGCVFKVENVSSITGRGTVATCLTLKGGKYQNPPFALHYKDGEVQCRGIERFANRIGKDCALNEKVGLLIPELEPKDIPPGTIFYTLESNDS